MLTASDPALDFGEARRRANHRPPTDYYSADYSTARERFVAAAQRSGFALRSLPIDAPSPDAQPLTIDVAVAGADQPRSAIVVSSGMHGVEGFFGSAVQLALLEQLPANWRPSEGSALILIHALNPFGFAWRRRFNEENVDLNRNFLLPHEEYTGSPPLCAAFRRVMLGGGVRRFDFSTARMAYLAMRHGLRSFWETLPVGQYDFPDWLFFGGQRRSQSAEVLQGLMPALLDGTCETVHLDFHTGLGRWNQFELLLSESSQTEHASWWQTHFGAERVRCPARTGSSYQVRGGLGQWLSTQLPNCQYRFATAEFGTYSPLRVIRALVQELACHAQHGAQSADHWARRQLADVFVPRSRRWRTNALEHGLALIRRAADALCQPVIRVGATANLVSSANDEFTLQSVV
jgi:hypothetical protein